MQSEEKDLSGTPVPDTTSHEQGEPPPQSPPPRRRGHKGLAVFLGVLAAIALLVALWDWNWFKGMAERRVTAATGRAFHIDGNLGVRLSMHPLVTMDGLRLANVPGTHDAEMATAEQLRFRVALWPLLSGRTELPEVHLVHPVVHFEKDAKGRDNWTFPPSQRQTVIRQFTIDRGLLTYAEAATKTHLAIAVQTVPHADADHLAALLFRGRGTYRGNGFTLGGTADSPLALADTQTPYRIDVTATAGRTHARATGAVRHPLQLEGWDLDFLIAGPDMGLLYRLIGVATPETPPYRLQGRLGHAAHVWSFRKFAGVVGSSDLAGDLTVDDRGPRKLLKANLASRKLDMHDLAGFIGAPAHANPARAPTEEQRAEAVKARASDRLLPQQPYELDKLRGMDADVALDARKVVGTRVPLDTLRARMTIRNGVVHLDPFDFGIAGGQFTSTIGLDASRKVIASSAKIRMRKVELGRLAPDIPAIAKSSGRIGADIDLRGTGNSIAKMLATSNGSVRFGMGGGRISDLAMAYAGLNIGRIIKLKIQGDHDIAIRCVIGDFGARDGIWDTRTFVFDTADTIIHGTGDVDLRDERFDLLLKVRPKTRSPLSLRAPLRVAGTFRDPSIRPDIKAIGVRGIAVVVLASIAPPAAELALIEYGGGKDSECFKGTPVKG